MSIILHHKDEFNKILQNYQPSSDAQQLLRSLPLGIFLGLSGGGRNTIINGLTATGRYHFIISDTTRPPKVRDSALEVDGVNYHFKDEITVLEDLKNGRYLEAEVIHDQQVSGISIQELERAQLMNKIPVNEVDIAGTENIRKIKPNTTFFFVVPPSYDVWLERLTGREDMSAEELDNRKATARRVLEQATKYDDWNFIVNDDIDDAVKTADAIMSQQAGATDDSNGRQVVADILVRLTN